MKKALIQIFLFIFVSFQVLIPINSAGSFATSEPNYPYAIQLGVFKNADAAARYIKAYGSKLEQGFYVKFVDYHVFYNAYKTKAEATAQLDSARKITSEAYVVSIKPTNQAAVNQQMAKKQPVKPATPLANTSKTLMPAKGDSQGTKIYNQPLSEDMLVTGVFGEGIVYFNVDQSWKVKDESYFDVYMDYPKEAFFSDSALTFLLNDIPIQSVAFGESKDKMTYIRIPLDKNKIMTGTNSIKIKTFIRTAEDLCENQTNPANWIVFSQKSFIHLVYESQPYTLKLSHFPYPYLYQGEDKPVRFEFLYDTGKPNPDVLEGIISLTSDLGRMNPFKDLNYSFAEPKAYKGEQSAIYLGTEVPSALKQWFKPEVQLTQSDMYIYEAQVTPSANLLFIIAKDAKQLKALAHMLSYKQVTSQIEQPYMTFSAEDFIDAKVDTKSNQLSLKDLGYGNALFEGSKNPSVSYFVSTPGNWQLNEGTKLVLNLRFSTLVDASNSTVTATVNDIPIGSKTLDSSYADGQVIEFVFPKQVLNSSKFNVGLVFSLGGEFNCTDLKSTKGFWAFVSNDSYVAFSKSDKNLFTLEDLPSPMVKEQAFNQLTLSMPKQSDLKTIKLMADLMSKFGQQTLNQGDFEVVFDKVPEKGNAIIIGTPSDSAIRESNAKAVVPYNETFKAFSKKEGLVLLSSEMNHYSTVQLISDEKAGSALLWLSSQTTDGYEWLGKYLTDSQLSAEIKGSAVFVNRNGMIQIYENPEQVKKQKAAAAAQPEVSRATYENMIGFIAFLGSLLVVTVLLIVFMNKRGKK